MPTPYPFALKIKLYTPSQRKWFMFYILPSIDNLSELLHPLLSQFNITRSQFLFLMGGYKVKSYLTKIWQKCCLTSPVNILVYFVFLYPMMGRYQMTLSHELSFLTSSSSFNKCIPLSRVLSHWKLYTCGQVSNLPFTIKIKTFQKCTIKNKEVEIMEGWCMSGYDGRCQWSLSWLGSVVVCSRVWWC
jgi:hypothetical protein